MSETPEVRVRTRRLELRRETVRDLGPSILSSQGHSLWTCDSSAKDDAWATGPARQTQPPIDE